MNEDNAPDPLSLGQEPWPSLRKPSWNTWQSVKQARLWHAVALALDLDSRNFQLFDTSRFAKLLMEPLKQFEDLLGLAKGNIRANGTLKLISPSNEGLEESEVKLSNFAKWLKTIQNQFAHKFPW